MRGFSAAGVHRRLSKVAAGSGRVPKSSAMWSKEVKEEYGSDKVRRRWRCNGAKLRSKTVAGGACRLGWRCM